jgi:hypothetical protein
MPEQQQVRTVSELATRVAADPRLAEQIRADPATALAQMAAPLQNDVWIYRIVVGALGLAVLLAVLGAIILATAGKTIPDVLTALGSAAVGALAGLLAPAPTGHP